MRAATVAATERRLVAGDRRFFSVMAFAALAIVFAGFATSYYLWPLTRATHFPAGQPISPSLPLIVHVHALAFTAWIVLFVVQVRLVATGRTALHRVMRRWVGLERPADGDLLGDGRNARRAGRDSHGP